MPPRPRSLLAAAVLGPLLGLCGLAAGQVVILPGTINTGISGISDDGTRVCGVRTGLPPYFWSQSTGYQYLTTPRTGSDLLLSGDGHTIAAVADFVYQSFTETDSGAVALVPHPFTDDTYASSTTGVSRDGSVMCGWDIARHSSFEYGWRWTASGGTQVLPGFQAATAMSGDGNTVFGNTGGGGHLMWRNGVTTQLPPGGEIAAVNFDGSIYAGRGGPTGLGIWNNNVLTSVSYLPGFGVGQFYDINEDGTVAVGWNGSSLTPFVWTPATGTQPLAAYFASQGFDLSAYRITNAHVSADGRTFGLTALDASSARGIIVTIPTPATPAAFAALLTLCPRRRRAQAQRPALLLPVVL